MKDIKIAKGNEKAEKKTKYNVELILFLSKAQLWFLLVYLLQKTTKKFYFE